MARPATAAVRLLTGEREPVRVATTANILLRGLQTIDGVPCEVGDRVLVKDQAEQRQNGIYTVSEGEWFRAADARTARTLQKGTTVHTQVGSVNAGRVFEFGANEPVVGSDALTIAPFVPPDMAEVVDEAESLRDETQVLKDATEASAGQAAASAASSAANAGQTAADVVTTRDNADRAETAEANALVLAGIYKTTAAGIAVTTSGQLFGVYAASSADIIDIYENAAGVAVATGRSYPAASIFQETLTQHMAREGMPISAASAGAGTIGIKKLATKAGLVTLFRFWSNVATTIKLKVWSLVGTTYTQVAERSVVTSVGLNTFTAADLSGLSVNIGEIIAIRNPVVGGIVNSTNQADGDGWFVIGGDATGASNPALSTNFRMEVQVDVDYRSQAVSATTFNALKSSVATIADTRTAPLELAVLDLGGSLPNIAATDTYLAALSSQPDAAHKKAIDRLNRWLDYKGLRAKLGGLTVHVTQSDQASLVDLMQPSRVMVKVNATEWIADAGIKGDGAYFNTGANPSGSIFKLDDCHMGIWSSSHETTGNDFGSYAGAGASAAFISMGEVNKRTGTLNHSYVGGAVISPAARLLSIGHAVITRDGTGNEKLYEDGVLTATAAHTPVAVPNGNFYLAALNNIAGGAPGSGWRIRRYAFTHWGAGLTAQNVADLYAGLLKYVQSVPQIIPIVAACDGNSLTRGAGTGIAYPTQLATSSIYSVVNRGMDSQTTQMMTADAAMDIDPYAAIANIRPVVVAWEIRNDMFLNSITRAAAYTNFKNYCLARKAAGFKVVAVTLAASIAGGTWNETERLAINALMRTETLGVYWDALADVGGDAAFQDYANLTYYSGDNVHHTGAAKAIIAALVKAAIATLVWA